MAQLTAQFPCQQLPDSADAAKLVGLYPQRQEGLWMQRTKVLGGRLSGDHWRTLAQGARQFSLQDPPTPLHLTTRQDVEFHNVSAEDVPALQRFLADAGMSAVGACGNTVRNVTVCTCSGLLSGRPEVDALAWAIQNTLAALPEVFTLPRKFKISLTCGPDCGQPWINDLGLIARQIDGQWGFAAIVAGSLGADPFPGMLLMDWLPPVGALRLARALVRFFNLHGDRENHSKARMRHVRRRMGDEAFGAALKLAYANEPPVLAPAIPLPIAIAGLDARRTLTFPNGDVTPDAADALGALADRDDLAVRVDYHHRVEVFGRTDSAIAEALAEQAALSDAAAVQPSVVTCPGRRWCKHALVDTNSVADRLRAELAGASPELTVCVSGCPNGCAHSRVAPIGLMGRRVKQDGEAADAFDIYAGGHLGCTSELGDPIAEKLSPDKAIQEAVRLAKRD